MFFNDCFDLCLLNESTIDCFCISNTIHLECYFYTLSAILMCFKCLFVFLNTLLFSVLLWLIWYTAASSIYPWNGLCYDDYNTIILMKPNLECETFFLPCVYCCKDLKGEWEALTRFFAWLDCKWTRDNGSWTNELLHRDDASRTETLSCCTWRRSYEANIVQPAAAPLTFPQRPHRCIAIQSLNPGNSRGPWACPR